MGNKLPTLRLLKDAKPSGTYSNGKGTWYELPNGKGQIGVRTSGRHGETLDFKNVNGVKDGFKIHQQ